MILESILDAVHLSRILAGIGFEFLYFFSLPPRTPPIKTQLLCLISPARQLFLPHVVEHGHLSALMKALLVLQGLIK